MPRTNNGAELFKQLTSVDKYVQVAGGDQTATAAVVAGVTLITVGATTSFASADPVFIIGDQGFELNAITGTPATAMPLLYKTQFAQAIGARLLEAQRIQLGDIEQGGVTITPSQQVNAILSAVSAVPIAQMAGPVELQASFSLLGFNNLNLATAFGISEAETGAGTTADPYALAIGEANINNVGYQAFRLTGTLFDGRTVMVDLLDARVQVGGTIQFNRQTPAVLPVTFKFNNWITRIST